MTRNKIDRFIGGIRPTGLFSERIAVGGEYDLTMRLKNAENYELGILLLVVQELQNGLLAIGGTTASGRGVFEKNGEILINGNAVRMQKYWKALEDKLKECR